MPDFVDTVREKVALADPGDVVANAELSWDSQDLTPSPRLPKISADVHAASGTKSVTVHSNSVAASAANRAAGRCGRVHTAFHAADRRCGPTGQPPDG